MWFRVIDFVHLTSQLVDFYKNVIVMKNHIMFFRTVFGEELISGKSLHRQIVVRIQEIILHNIAILFKLLVDFLLNPRFSQWRSVSRDCGK